MSYFKILFVLLSFFFLSFNSFAEESDDIISKITNSIAGSLENFIGKGGGDTEVQITAGEEYKPEFTIMTVRPLAAHPGIDAWFVQLQLNDQKIRGSNRLSTNVGLGYRKLSENKNTLSGANVFIDYDEKGNARASIGLELRASAFEAIANYYQALSDGKTVGDYTERSLDGMEISIIGEVPYLPWANIIVNSYEWQKNKNSKDSKGEKYSLELTLTPNFILEGGFDENNIDAASFVKAYYVFPPRDRVAATTNFIGEAAFSSGDMSDELLSKVRRTNKQIIESEGSGVVMARSN